MYYRELIIRKNLKLNNMPKVIFLIVLYFLMQQSNSNFRNSFYINKLSFQELSTYFPEYNLKGEISIDSLISIQYKKIKKPNVDNLIPMNLVEQYLCPVDNFDCNCNNYGLQYQYYGIARIKEKQYTYLIYRKSADPYNRLYLSSYTNDGCKISTLLVRQWNYVEQINVCSLISDTSITINLTQYNVKNGEIKINYKSDSTNVCRSKKVYKFCNENGLKFLGWDEECNLEYDSLGINKKY